MTRNQNGICVTKLTIGACQQRVDGSAETRQCAAPVHRRTCTHTHTHTHTHTQFEPSSPFSQGLVNNLAVQKQRLAQPVSTEPVAPSLASRLQFSPSLVRQWKILTAAKACLFFNISSRQIHTGCVTHGLNENNVTYIRRCVTTNALWPCSPCCAS